MPLSSSCISTELLISSPSIVPCPSLQLYSCVSSVYPSPQFLSLTHPYHRCPHQNHHLLFHFHFTLRIHRRHFCLVFLFSRVFYPRCLSSYAAIVPRIHCYRIHHSIPLLDIVPRIYFLILLYYISNISSL